MNQASDADKQVGLIRFVREALGCGCPDEIVERTTVEETADGERGLNVGGRLLVRVIASDDLDALIGDFPETVERLRDERDRRGFRRLRMVVVHPEPEIVAGVLQEMLPILAVADDRVFLHAVTRPDLPPILVTETPSP